MDLVKIGSFIRELRKEKALTQEQLAEAFRVSRRTVSRWETGSNMPDLDVLMEMSAYFSVDLRELLDGERKQEKMDKELEETVLKVADYSSENKEKLMARMHLLFIGGTLAAILYMVLLFTDRADSFLGGLCQGITFGMMLVGVLLTGKLGPKLRTWKLKLLHRQ